MKRRRFSEERIVGLLKEDQAGLGARELCRKHGVSDAAFINGDPSMTACLARQGIAERCPKRGVSGAQRLKALEAERRAMKEKRYNQRRAYALAGTDPTVVRCMAYRRQPSPTTQKPSWPDASGLNGEQVKQVTTSPTDFTR